MILNSPTLSLYNISFSREPPPARPILSNISWQVAASQIAAILGPNGCGKSTLLRIAAGYLWPQNGSVRLLGQSFGEVPLAPLRAQIGIVEASTVYPFDETMTARDVALSGYFTALTIAYARPPFPTREQAAHADELLDQVGLASHKSQLFATLSTGERLRCLLARALVRKPALLLLDEPTAGLDLPAREAILATLTRLHQKANPSPAIVTITHHLEELLPNTSEVLLLSREGAIAASGPPEKVLTDGNLTAAYGIAIHVTQRNGRFHAHVDPATWEGLM